VPRDSTDSDGGEEEDDEDEEEEGGDEEGGDEEEDDDYNDTLSIITKNLLIIHKCLRFSEIDLSRLPAMFKPLIDYFSQIKKPSVPEYDVIKLLYPLSGQH
jgi:hypothetical protein